MQANVITTPRCLAPCGRSTSDDPSHKAYERLTEKVNLKLGCFVTEVGLKWSHFSEVRGQRAASGVLHDESHMAIMRHNFSNVAPDL